MNENSEEKTRPMADLAHLKADSRELEEVDEPADDVELDDAEESDPEKTTELDLNGKAKKRKPAAKKPKVAAKKRREPTVTEDDITEVLEPKFLPPPAETKKKEERVSRKKTEVVAAEDDLAEAIVAHAAPAEEAKKPEKRKTEPMEAAVHEATHEAEHLREDVSIAAASLHKTMEAMVKQWGSVKEITGSISNELERVNTMLKTPAPQADPVDVREYLKQAAPRITLANKIALGVSAAAVVFSVLSLSLASSTRATLMDRVASTAWRKETPKPVAVREPVKPAPVAVEPKKPEPPTVVKTAEAAPKPQAAGPSPISTAPMITQTPIVPKVRPVVQLPKPPSELPPVALPRPRKHVAVVAKAAPKRRAVPKPKAPKSYWR